jgi:ureidoglycolate lyase
MTARPDIADLVAVPLSRANFAPFGDVVALDGTEPNGRPINQGTAIRFNDLIHLDMVSLHGRARAGLVRALPVVLPVRLRLLERHVRGSQLFLPLGNARFVVVVAEDGPHARPGEMSAFVSNGRQGVNYRRGVWHHPLLALDEPVDFLVVDSTSDENCEEIALTAGRQAVLATSLP